MPKGRRLGLNRRSEKLACAGSEQPQLSPDPVPIFVLCCCPQGPLDTAEPLLCHDEDRSNDLESALIRLEEEQQR